MEVENRATKRNKEEKMEDDDDEDLSSSSSDDSDDGGSESADGDVEVNAEERIKLDSDIERLTNAVKEAPYTYDLHVQLICSLRQRGGQPAALRTAREKMAEIFPLAENLWLDWLRDETGSEETDKEYITSLFERSVKDYTSIQIWLEMFYFSMRQMAEPGGTEAARQVAERAISHVGLHVTEGAAIWEAYREFENVILATLQPAPGTIVTAEALKQISDQTVRVGNLFKRQLSVPLLDMEKTYIEYESWIDGIVDEQTKSKYNKALTKLGELKPFEDALRKASLPNIDAYMPLIEHELKNKDASRIQTVFERAIKENCLHPELWSKYIEYLSTELKDARLVLSAIERAVRNCPWSAALWVGYMQFLEQYSKTHDEIKAVLSRALLAGFTEGSDFLLIWMAYLDYLRRQIDWDSDHEQKLEELRTTFERAINQLLQHFSWNGDPECSLTQYWAFIEAKYCKNMSKARELWSGIMQAGFGAKAHMWLEYVRLERCYGDVKHCRKILQRAVNSVSDWPESICQAYLNFERQEGDLENYKLAVTRCEAQMKRVEERRASEAAKEAEISESKKASKPNRKGGKKGFEEQKGFDQKKGFDQRRTSSSEDSGAVVRPYQKAVQRKDPKNDKNVNEDSKRINEKLKALASDSGTSKESWSSPVVFVRGQAQKRKLNDSSDSANPTPTTAVMTDDGFKLPPPPGAPPGAPPGVGRSKVTAMDDESSPVKRSRVEDEKVDQQQTASMSARPVGQRDLCTVFVSNLDYAVTEQQIREIFSSVGDIVEIRLVTNFKGRSKGYAYVEFKDELTPAAALKLDRTPIEGRPMFVSECNKSSSSTNKLKFSVGLEKNKLFVKGLSFSTTKKELEQCFSAHGKLKDVRLVTYRNGTSKGLAYVEYITEEAASQAVLKMDGFELQGHVISVAISNPPARKGTGQGSGFSQGDIIRSFVPSLGGGKKETSNERGKARTQLSLVPRSVNHPQAAGSSAAGKQNNGSTVANGSSGNTESSSTSSSSSMSNADFRNMLLKK